MLITDTAQLKNYDTPHRLWQGIPAIERTKGGRIFISFYSGGTQEQIGNYCLLIMSDDEEHFSSPIAVAYLDDHRCYDPCLWIDPLDRLWFIWNIMPDHAVYASICNDPDADVLEWSEPFVIGNDIMLNKPTVLSTGEWLFPVAVWNQGVRVLSEKYDTHAEPGSYVYRTSDNGKTFTKLGGAQVPDRCYDEHMVLERSDMVLAMLVRTYYGIGVSYSYDRGRTWSPGEDSGLGGPNSRFFIRRLRSGRILLINHVNFTGRNNLTALLSEDEGQTWPYKLMLDSRSDVSYPDAVEDETGRIYITYDRERGAFKHSLEEVYSCAREILTASVTERDIMAGKLVDDRSYLKRVVNKLGAYADEILNPFREYARFTDEQLAECILKSAQGEQAIEKVFEIYPLNCCNLHNFNAKTLDRLSEEFCSGKADDKKCLMQIIALVRSASGSAAGNPIIFRVMETIRNRLDQDLSVTELADKVDMSVYYLCHLFKNITGVSITHYRNMQRLAMAKKMLIETDEKVLDIAMRCGYNSSSYFSEVFAHDEAMSPSKFRSLHRPKV